MTQEIGQVIEGQNHFIETDDWEGGVEEGSMSLLGRVVVQWIGNNELGSDGVWAQGRRVSL